ncbi:MAG: DUF4397 domain-containing protein [Anaerolineaceae bacterium]|nr:DUF4397 domain-containing protein [Anaerolineaceae bacterium]
MKRVLRALAILVSLIVLAAALPVAAQGDGSARFVHVIPGASAIDVYVNGTLAISELAYGQASGYVNIPAQSNTVTVTPSGINTTVLWEQTVNTAGSTATTYVASSAETPRFDAFNDNLSSTSFGNTRLLLIHAIAGGPAVDVTLAEPVTLNGSLQDAGTALATNMAYSTSFGAFDLPAQNYVVNVSITGTIDTLISNLALPLDAGTSHIAIIHGTADNPAALVASSQTTAQAGNGFVRFVHAAPEAPAVDVYVNDSLIAPSLDPSEPTKHLALPAGEHSVLIRVAGTEDEVLSGNLTVVEGEAQSLVVLPDGDGATVNVFPDNISGVNETTAVASVINAIPDSTVSVGLSNGTTIGDAAFGAASSAASFEPGSYVANYDLAIGDESGTLQTNATTFYGGVYYNLILLPGSMFNPPQLMVVPTVLSQGLTSAPGMGSMTIAGGSMSSAEQPTEAPIAEPTQEQAAEVVQPVSTPAPVQSADVVTGRVLLDPGANLHLRQYPSADAFSLGLAPSGTILTVTAREGGPVALVEGEEPPPEAADYVDPATLLEDEDADLIPEETWLRVVYSTPDGGEIEAWVNALYLDVRDSKGDLQRLADLPIFGNNVPGEARNTAVTPPPIPENRVSAIIMNLNPGVSLNIRRTPETGGEVLERLPNGTATEFVGLIMPDEDGAQDWVFVSYSPAGGGVITGWASLLYLRFEFNGRSITLDEMNERGLLEEADPELRGAIRGGASQATAPTPDPTRDAYVAEVNLNPGANLQFRLTPDATSESLNLIPSGSRLIIDGRTPEGDWLLTNYDGQSGWVAADFVVLSFNGRFVDVIEVPVVTLPEPEAEATQAG